MALFSRKFLSAMGIEDDKIEQICAAHTEVLEEIKTERDSLRSKVKDLDDVQKQLDAAQSKLKEYEGENGENLWKSKYDAEKSNREKAEKDFADYRTAIENEKALASKQNGYRSILKEAGISEKRFDSILRVTDFSKIECDKDGKIKDAENIKKNVQTEWADFIATTSERGAGTANPPANNGTGTPNMPSRAAQIAAQYHANLYGAKKED